jgi:hypothetical protein
MPLPLSLRISGIVQVNLMYLIKWTNLVQSSLSGARTIVVNNMIEIAVQVSGLAHLVAYVDPAFNTALMKSGTQKEDPKSDNHLTNHTHMTLTDHSETLMSAMNRKRQRNNHMLTT